MTTVPRMGSVSIAVRMASTATWSEYFRLPCPIVRAASTAASSVTRRNSRERESRPIAISLLERGGSAAREDVHDAVQELDGVGARPLERVAADDRAECA